MRFVTDLAIVAFATSAVATRIAQPGWDKYAGERGYAGHEDPAEFGHGGMYAREADADDIKAWESAHGGKPATYKPYGGNDDKSSGGRGGYSQPMARSEPWEHSQHGFEGAHYGAPHHARAVETFDHDDAEMVAHAIHDFGYKPSDEHSWAKPAHAARAVRDAYEHYTGKAPEGLGPGNPISGKKGMKHYSRDAEGKVVYTHEPHPDFDFQGEHGSPRHMARDAFVPSAFDPKIPADDPKEGNLSPADMQNDVHYSYGQRHHARDAEARNMPFQYEGLQPGESGFRPPHFGPHHARRAEAHMQMGFEGAEHHAADGPIHRPHSARDVETKAGSWDHVEEGKDEPFMSKISHSLNSVWGKETMPAHAHHARDANAETAHWAAQPTASHTWEEHGRPTWTKHSASKTAEPTKGGWLPW